MFSPFFFPQIFNAKRSKYVLPSVKFPNRENVSCFSCFSWKKEENLNLEKKLFDKNGIYIRASSLLNRRKSTPKMGASLMLLLLPRWLLRLRCGLLCIARSGHVIISISGSSCCLSSPIYTLDRKNIIFPWSGSRVVVAFPSLSQLDNSCGTLFFMTVTTQFESPAKDEEFGRFHWTTSTTSRPTDP